MTMDLLDFEMLCGILTGVVAIIIAVVVNKTWKYVHLAKFKREFPNEKIEFVYSPTWKILIGLPMLCGFVLGSTFTPLVLFPSINSIYLTTQSNKYFFLLICIVYFLTILVGVCSVLIYTSNRIVIYVPDKLGFFTQISYKSGSIFYKKIDFIEKFEYGIKLHFFNEETEKLVCDISPKIYNKLQLLLDNYKEEN